MLARWFVVMLPCSLTACAAPIEPPAALALPVLAVEPLGPDGAGPAPRLRLAANGAASIDPAELSLWSGELSDTQVSRLRRKDVPAALLERAVPALGWVDPSSAEVIVRPTRYLNPGTHTLVSASLGRVGAFEVRADGGAPRLTRRWPPAGEAGAGLSMLCAATVPAQSWAFALDPSLNAAELETEYGTLDGFPCVAVRWPLGAGELSLLPPEIEGHALDPEPYFPAPPLETSLSDCAQLSAGPLCASVEDDRLAFVNAGPARLVRLWRSAPAELLLVPGGSRAALRGLIPDQEHRLTGEVVERSGESTAFELEFRTLPARPRWVLNEVLANPLGREPAEEWIELVNASSLAADLGGLVLEDSAGRVELPALLAAPGAHVLVVREDFASFGQDVVPAEATPFLRVAELGKNGLSNSGEPLRLLDRSGAVLSAFPPLASKHAGVSLARRNLDTLDGDMAGFAEHAAPGASPGAANRVLDAE
jgi:hypothetical protein